MSRQEEDKKNSGSSGKAIAVGLAATALGVGIGTALYYFFNKDEENNDAGPSAEWENQQAFDLTSDKDDSDSYTTISVNTTSDTSMYDDETPSSSSSDIGSNYSNVDSPTSDLNSFFMDVSNDSHESNYIQYLAIDTSFNSSTDSDNEWDVTNTIEVPHVMSQTRSPIRNFVDSVIANRSIWSRRNKMQKEAERLKEMRQNKFRGRSYTLEECSICFEVMLKNEDLMGLPCTHNFHVKCIAPWLHEHQTCPVCRGNAD